MSQVLIPPTVGRVVWFYPDSNSAEAGFHRHADGGGPYAALIAHVWSDRMVNLSVLDANGNIHGRTSVPLLHGDDAIDSPFCMWMPFQKGQARAQAASSVASDACKAQSAEPAAKSMAINQRVNDALKAATTGVALPPAADAHIRNVLYGAIRNAMEELGALHAGFNDHVNRAWNHLHRAYWSEVPAPASAPGLRDTSLSAEPAADLASAEQQGAVDQIFQAKGAIARAIPSIVRETIAYRRYMAFEQVETHRIQVAKHETNLAKEKCDHRDAVQLLAELDQWLAANPAPVA